MKKEPLKTHLPAAFLVFVLASASVLAMEAQTDAKTEATLQAQPTAESQPQTDFNVKPDVVIEVATMISEENGDHGLKAEVEAVLEKDLLKAKLGSELQAIGRPELPARPERPEAAGGHSAELREIMAEAAAERRAFLAAQTEALAELRGKGPLERETLRNELQEAREAWLSMQQNIGIELRTRLAEIRAELQNSVELETVLAAAKEEARQRRGQD